MKLVVKTSALLLAALLGLVNSQMFFPSRPPRNFDENSDEVTFPKPTNFPRMSVVFPQPSVSLQRFLNQNANGQIGQAPRQPNTQQFGNNQGVTIIRQPSNFRLIENDQTAPVIRQPNRQQQNPSGQGFAGTQQPISNIQIGSIVTPLPQQLNPQFGNSQITPGILNSQGVSLSQQPTNQQAGIGQSFPGVLQPDRRQETGSGQGFTGTQQPSRNQPSESSQGFTGTQQPSRPQHAENDRVTTVSQPNIPNFQAGGVGQEFIPDQSGGSPGRRRHHLCGVQPSPGECRGAFPRYYYNPKTDQCDCFVYGGCGQEGLESSYKTLKECHRTCLPSNLQEGPTCITVFADEQTVFHHKPPPVQPTPTFFHDRLTADQFLKQELFRFN